MSVTEEQKKLLQSTVSTARENSKQITDKFYSTLFKEHPEFKNFFNQTNQKTGKQPAALAETIFHFIEHLDNLDVMKPQMSRLSNKHRAVTVKPEHYPIVGKYLLPAIKENLGNKNTPEVSAAYDALYALMTSIFIKQEKELYAKLGNDEHDKGFVPFKVTKKEQIASGPTYAFTLERADGGKLWNTVTGQYITIQIERDGILHNGHYIPTEPFNGKNYSVACKQGLDTDQNTIISDECIRNREVGSTVLVSAPSGSFGLSNDAKNHLFISGGIGIASFVAMIEELNQQGKSSSVSLIQCVRTPGHAAFGDKLRNMLPKGQYVMLTQEEPISKSHLEGKVKPDTHIYVSGSEKFLAMAEKALAGFNHPSSQVHYKSIEPTLGLLKAIDHQKK
jgi:nitric oxide dioxygenase